MSDLEAIDDYLNGQLSPDKRAAFESRLTAEPALTESLAFYLQARQVAREAALAERHGEWAPLRRKTTRARQVRPLYIAVASLAAMLLLVLGWWGVFRQPAATPEVLAEAYIRENFTDFGMRMSGESDSLQTALNLANSGQNQQALTLLADLVRRDSTNDFAKNYAGVVALRLGNYDQAIGYFHGLSQQPGLFTNPGTFHEALARMKRGRPLDKKEAERLLRIVVRENLEGKEEAARMIENW